LEVALIAVESAGAEVEAYGEEAFDKDDVACLEGGSDLGAAGGGVEQSELEVGGSVAAYA